MATVAVVAAAIGVLTIIATITTLALRLSGVKSERDRSKLDLKTANEGLDRARSELDANRTAYVTRIRGLEAELRRYRTVLANLPDSPSTRRAVLAELDAQLDRVLADKVPDTDSGGE